MNKNEIDEKVKKISSEIFQKQYQKLCESNDRVFVLILILQWVGAVLAAWLFTPKTWLGHESSVHFHVIFAFVTGAILTLFPVFLNLKYRGAVFNRYVNVTAQGLYSALLIHLSGGRIETHFHVFGSLAFFAFYRDLKVLAVGTVVVAVDHFIRGMWYPQSAFGIFDETRWRWVEHASWVVFEDFFLGYSCLWGMKEMRVVATNQAEVTLMHERAELLVTERTFELEKERNQLADKNETISVIYKNVKSGFLLVNRELTIDEGYTDSCKKLLDASSLSGIKISSALKLEGKQREHFQVMLEQVFDDLLPEAVTLSEIPSRVRMNEKVLQLAGSVVREKAGTIKNVLFTINDISELDLNERVNRENQAVISVLKYRDTFELFIEKLNQDLKSIKNIAKTERDQQKIIRFVLHTIKGNAGAYRLIEMASMIHEIEENSFIQIQDIDKIEDGFRSFLKKNYPVLGIEANGPTEEKFTLTLSKIKELLTNLHVEDHEASKAWLVNIHSKNCDTVLNPLISMGEDIAKRSGKKIKFNVVRPDELIDVKYLNPVLQSLTHLVRNSIDHGIETASKRGKKGSEGTITFDFKKNPQQWLLAISDDGQGLDSAKIKAKAVSIGLLSPAEAEKLSAAETYPLVFKNGLSTANEINEISGRGVGMSAVLDAVTALQGTIQIDSSQGQGTKFTIIVPASQTQKALTKRAS